MSKKCILFDFDGVICESLREKTNAFYSLYLPFGEDIAQKVIKHHTENMGVSRFEKIKYYHKTFLDSILTTEEVLIFADKFSSLVMQKVIEAPLVGGLTSFLDKYSSSFDFKIITATPSEEIIKIISEKKLSNYFSSLHGSPESKSYWIQSLLSTGTISATNCYFIGDAISDYNAAEENGIPFILRRTDSNSKMATLPKILFNFIDYFEFENKLVPLLF